MNLAPLAMTTDPDILNRLAQRAAQWRNQQDDADLNRIEAAQLRLHRRIAQRERKAAIVAARRNKEARRQFEAGE